MTDVIGPFVSTYQIEQAVGPILSTWFDRYLAEVERAHSLTVGHLQRPKSAQTAYDLENWPEAQLPALIVMCPGTVGEPEKQGTGLYGAWFEITVGLLVEDTTEANARMVAALNQVALELVMVQQASRLAGLGTNLRWQSRRIALPDVENRTLALGESVFHAFVDGVLDHQGGPAAGTAPAGEGPFPPWPKVATADITVKKL